MTKRDRMIKSYLRWSQRHTQKVARDLGYRNWLGFKRDRDIDFRETYEEIMKGKI